MNIEELQVKKALYERIKEVLENVINTFSSTNFNDEILSVRKALSSCLIINDEDIYARKIYDVQEGINTDLQSIKQMIPIINKVLDDINKKIIDIQIETYM